MKRKRLYLICAAALLLSYAFFSCKTELNPAGGINIVLWGHVKNGSDAPVEGIMVTSNYGYTLTDEEGYFEILGYYYPNNKKVKLSFTDKSETYKEIKEREFTTLETIEVILENN